jgi:hypothetical protein
MITHFRKVFSCTASVLVFALAAVTAGAAERTRDQVVDGVAIYFGILPAELVRGHPRAHPESEMHGGIPVGESHIVVSMFDDKTGKRLTDAEVRATITGPDRFRIEKKLESMPIAGSMSYGNYFAMLGPGPYRIELRIRLPGSTREIQAVFTWARA